MLASHKGLHKPQQQLMSYASVSALSRLTGMTRETVTKRLQQFEVPSRKGTKNGKEFETKVALPVIMGAGNAETLVEAQRQLALARTAGQVLANETTRKTRIPIDDVMEINEELFRNIRGIVMRSRLDDEGKQEIFRELREAGTKVEKLPSKP
jgi:hypothetical protein